MAAAGATDGGCAALFDVHLHVVLEDAMDRCKWRKRIKEAR